MDARWYAVALLTAPLSMMAMLLALSLASPEYLPRIFTAGDKLALLRLRYGVLVTGLIVGVMWGAWHLPVNVWGSGVTSGDLSPAIFEPDGLVPGVPGGHSYVDENLRVEGL